MKTFKDKDGREWSIDLNHWSIKRVKDLTGIELRSVLNEKFFQDFCDDPVQIGSALWALVKPQADAKRISEEVFCLALDGDAARDGLAALARELIDFFHEAGQRSAIHQVFDRIMQDRKAVDETLKNLDQAKIQELLAKSQNNAKSSAGNAPASSESILGHSPSANS